MKKGDIVRVLDGSYSLVADGSRTYHPTIRNDSSALWEVLAIECKLPTEQSPGLIRDKEMNDTILRSLDDDRILFTQERFLGPAHRCHVCPHCGEKIGC